MTNVMIRQPGYMPNIGFFKKIQSSDIFVYLDDAQFAKDRFDNRNKIRTDEGFRWITVPLKRPVYRKKLNEIIISYENDWITEHIDLIFENYNKKYRTALQDFFPLKIPKSLYTNHVTMIQSTNDPFAGPDFVKIKKFAKETNRATYFEL